MMRNARALYIAFVMLILFLLVAATIPIVASDLFRQPYSPLWPVINRTLARLRINPYPTGGGAPPRFPYWRDPADASIYYRDLTLTTDDGVRISGWYVPAGHEPPCSDHAPTILLAHGLLDRKETMLQIVPWLHEAGYNVMLIDFRGHGGSEQCPTTIGAQEKLDIQAALDWLDAESVGDRVGGLGMSLGAAALVNAAAHDDRLDALVLDSMFADWSDVDYAEDYRLPPDWLVPGVPSPEELMPLIRVPVFIIHGTADILTDVDHAHRVYQAANQPKELWVNDSGHAWSAWTYPDQYQQRVLEFFAGLRSAIENYEEKHGLVKSRTPTTMEVVRTRLKKVMNPMVGLDLVRTNLVQTIEVNKGTVRVVIDLPSDHQFAPSIQEEIREKIEPLWDVNEVIIEFTE